MKLSKEDIKKFATEDEKKLLEAGIKIRKPKGRPFNIAKTRAALDGTIRQYKEYLEVEIDNIRLFHNIEKWEDLAIELNDAIADVKKIMELEGQGDQWPL